MNKTLLTAALGAEFQVTLESTPSSGARWSFLPDPGGPELVREEAPTAVGAVGDPTNQIFVFRSASRGTYTLRFVLKRSWENASRRETTVRVDVH